MTLVFKDEKALRHLVRTMQDERNTDKARIAKLESAFAGMKKEEKITRIQRDRWYQSAGQRQDDLNKANARIAELEAALKEIAKQQKVDELEFCGGDFEYGFDVLVDIARKALVTDE